MKQWWIEFDLENGDTVYSTEMPGTINVIEKSEYDKVIKELNELKALKAKAGCNLDCADCGSPLARW